MIRRELVDELGVGALGHEGLLGHEGNEAGHGLLNQIDTR